MSEEQYNETHSSEGSEANGKDASYRNAPSISVPKTIVKRRIGGALVPMGNTYETLD